MASLFNELKRRNVFRVAITYLVAAWVVAQVSGLAADAFEAPGWVMRMIITGLVIGFVPVLIFSWIFELTPEGLKRERDLIDEPLATSHTTRKLDIAVIVLLVAAIGLLLGDRFLLSTPAPAPPPVAEAIVEQWRLDSIAVLPFADFSPTRDQAWLGEGIAETLLHALAQIEGLRVSARTSSFAYRDRDADIATIGRELGVATVLEGSVQRAGDRLRIVAQLVRTDTHDHIFSKTFDRDVDDIFAIQDEIAQAVAESLMGAAAPEQRELARTETDVYDLYLEGRQLWQRRTSTDVNRAAELLEQAVSRDPDFAPARSELATARLFQALYADAELDDLRDDIESHLRRALELDPEDAQAWATRGLLLDEMGLIAEALDALHRAEALNPNDANIQIWLANRYNNNLNYDRALAHYRRAFELDPLNRFVRSRYTTMLSWMDRENPAIERVARDSVRLFPDDEQTWNALLNVYGNRGRDDEIILAGVQGARQFPDSANMAWWIASSLNRLGEFDIADLWIERLGRLHDTPMSRAGFLYNRGNPEGYLEAARQEYEHLGEAAIGNPRGNLISALWANSLYQEAWELVIESLPDFEERREASALEEQDLANLLTAIWLGRKLGEQEAVQALQFTAESLWEDIGSSEVMADSVFPQLSLDLVLGRKDEAIALLPKIPDGQLLNLAHALQHIPMYQGLAEGPEAQALMAHAEQRRLSYVERLHAEAPPELFNPDLLDTPVN